MMNGVYGNPRIIGGLVVKDRARIAYRTFLCKVYSPTLKNRPLVMRAFWMLRWSVLRKELFKRLQHLVVQKNIQRRSLQIYNIYVAAGETSDQVADLK